MDRQDFTMHWATGWQVVPEGGGRAGSGTAAGAVDLAAATDLAAAMVRPCLDLSGGRGALLRALGEASLLLKVPARVQADPAPVLSAYVGAMAGYPVMACDDAIRSWPDAHDFWPDWPGLRAAIQERAAVLHQIAAALRQWIDQQAGGQNRHG